MKAVQDSNECLEGGHEGGTSSQFFLLKLESCFVLLTAAADKVFIAWWRESGNISQNLTDCCLALVLACVNRGKLKCPASCAG